MEEHNENVVDIIIKTFETILGVILWNRIYSPTNPYKYVGQ